MILHRAPRALISTTVGLTLVAIIRSRVTLVLVDGLSMQPALRDRSRVLVLRSGAWLLRRRMIVLARHPNLDAGLIGHPDACGHLYTPFVIKRIAAVEGDPVPGLALPGAKVSCSDLSKSCVPPGYVYLVGDAPACEDSRVWGPVASSLVIGTVIIPWKR